MKLLRALSGSFSRGALGATQTKTQSVTAFAKFFESKVDKVPVCRVVDPGEDVRLVSAAAAAGDDPRNDSDQVVLKSSSPALSNKTSYHVVLYTLIWQSCSVLLINPT